MHNLTIATLLADWRQQGLTEMEEARIANLTAARLEANPLPGYIRLFSGIGAVVALSFFLPFFVIIKVIDFDSAVSMGLWGMVFTAAALFFATRSAEQVESFSDALVTQITLVLLFLGKGLLVGAMTKTFDGWDDRWLVFTAFMVVTAATYPFSRFVIDRYLSVLATIVVGFLCLALPDWNAPTALSQTAVSLYFCLLMALAALFFARPQYHAALTPLQDAVLTGLLLMMTLFPMMNGLGLQLDYADRIVRGGLTIALLAIVIWMGGGTSRMVDSPLKPAACLAVIALGFFSTPGILLALGFMILGYGRHEKPLLINGTVFFAGFLGFFYYDLNQTLIEKSLTLAVSGAVALSGWFYLRHHEKRAAV